MDNVEKLARLLEKALRPIAEALGASMDEIEDLEIDTYGPRIIIQFKPSSATVRTVFIDASPDGVEAVYTAQVATGKQKHQLEEAIAQIIETEDTYQAVEEYDVSYNPETGEVTITLTAKIIPELPSIRDVERLLEKAQLKT
ncbi:hypothetical protein [Hyperthermus butylicus]|uniref:Uncharacterized protein n=1 Tax=Hyperthermus butylicus (strain DSM 5456 / JCM 9403 / PLM1-5) TaxID=415426 RepID=A2BLM6_HYPBU|nr:hypothetical protein [Hyperthermus butylicus]ABM80887.1 hypothetical protein Hbut_1043 [Hyperthermus butylicus DSM 5456]